MSNTIIKKFDPVIYAYSVWVIIGTDESVITKNFDEYSGKPIIFNEGDIDNLDAFTMPVVGKSDHDGYGVILRFRNKKSMTYELVAHEASHAAKFLFDHIRANITEHEPFEYVVGWIAGCCDELRKSKTNI